MPGLNPTVIPVGSVRYAHFVHLPNDPAGLFYGALTVTALPTSLGGVGLTDLVCGYYDVVADTFTPNSDAAALNSLGHDFLMTIHHSGLFAVFDRYNAWAWLAARTSLTQPWQVVGMIANVPPPARRSSVRRWPTSGGNPT